MVVIRTDTPIPEDLSEDALKERLQKKLGIPVCDSLSFSEYCKELPPFFRLYLRQGEKSSRCDTCACVTVHDAKTGKCVECGR